MQFNLKNWASLLSSALAATKRPAQCSPTWTLYDFATLVASQVQCYPEVSRGEDSGKKMCRVPIQELKDRNFQIGHIFRLTEVSFPCDENEMQLNTGWVCVRALPFIPCAPLSCYHEPSVHFLRPMIE